MVVSDSLSKKSSFLWKVKDIVLSSQILKSVSGNSVVCSVPDNAFEDDELVRKQVRNSDPDFPWSFVKA